MKNILLLATFLFSSVSFSQVQRPSVSVFGNRIQVQVTNYSIDDLRCSGFVYGRLSNGMTESYYYSDIIYRGMSSFTNFYSRNLRDIYFYAYHNVYCFRF